MISKIIKIDNTSTEAEFRVFDIDKPDLTGTIFRVQLNDDGELSLIKVSDGDCQISILPRTGNRIIIK